MTTSGTTSFSVSRDDLIKGALRKIGIIAGSIAAFIALLKGTKP